MALPTIMDNMYPGTKPQQEYLYGHIFSSENSLDHPATPHPLLRIWPSEGQRRHSESYILPPYTSRTSTTGRRSGLSSLRPGGLVQRPRGVLPVQEVRSTGVEWRPSRAFLFAFGSLVVVSVCVSLEAACLALALPTIASELHGTSIQAFWAGCSFLLASSVSQPIFAAFSTLFGRKAMIQISCVFFGIGAIVCGQAHNFTVLLLGRTIMGVGGGGIITLAETTVTDLVPLRYRAKYLGYLGSAWAAGMVSGPLLGAVLVEKASWRWIFWSMIPFVVLGFIAITFYLNQTPCPGTFTSKMRRFDWVGATCLTVSLVCFLVGLSWGGTQYAWHDWRTWFPLVQGAEGIIFSVLYEFLVAKEPIISPNIFNNRSMVVCFLLAMAHGVVVWCMLYFLVIYYEAVKFFDTIPTALAAMPETLTIVASGIIAGLIATKTGQYRPFIQLGWAVAILGFVLLSLLGHDTPTIGWIFLNLPIGISTGVLFTTVPVAIQAAGRPEDAGPAASFFSFCRSLGQAVGVSVGGTILQNRFKKIASGLENIAPLAEEFSREVEGLIAFLKSLPRTSAMKDELVRTYSESLQSLWYFLAGFSAVAFLLSFLVKSYTLDQAWKTNQALVEKKGKQRGV